MLQCPLCDCGDSLSVYHSKTTKNSKTPFIYWQCGSCSLVFLQPDQRLSPEEERQRYEKHENVISDPGYRSFLQLLVDYMMPNIHQFRLHSSLSNVTGLDYGCGSNPTISVLLEEEPFIKVKLFDAFFYPYKELLETNAYDFITCSETAEHFFYPHQEFKTLVSCLKAGASLGVMTGFLPEQDAFASWYYHRDPTHVCFYSERTFQWIARNLGCTVEFPKRNIAILTKAAPASDNS
eukprot:GILJ01013457.1.p1 GENE.GILJ01013457.1~~GILJ01013457.1.p1  ORF type:complete len:236 (+),score=11.90 GILJ01013457.1:36-743(+)